MAKRHPDKLTGSGVGIGALLRVLVTVLGTEEVIPVLERLAEGDPNNRVVVSARVALEDVKQKRLFAFAPVF